jgi:hypothetical protein
LSGSEQLSFATQLREKEEELEEAHETIARDERIIQSWYIGKVHTVQYISFHFTSFSPQHELEKDNRIRGGNYWKAVAGATKVDDSGLVLLCPKSNVQNVFCDYSEYVAVVGNGQFLAKKKKEENVIPKDAVELSSIGKVRKGQEGNTCQTARVTIAKHLLTCSHVVSHAQSQFEDGIHGDPAANPLDRRAPRLLIHCNAMSASSLLFDETVQT